VSTLILTGPSAGGESKASKRSSTADVGDPFRGGDVVEVTAVVIIPVAVNAGTVASADDVDGAGLVLDAAKVTGAAALECEVDGGVGVNVNEEDDEALDKTGGARGGF
jgi:hypothetical protein